MEEFDIEQFEQLFSTIKIKLGPAAENRPLSILREQNKIWLMSLASDVFEIFTRSAENRRSERNYSFNEVGPSPLNF